MSRKHGFWLVWSQFWKGDPKDMKGGVRCLGTRQAALEEVKRLATKYPGQDFDVLAASDSEKFNTHPPRTKKTKSKGSNTP